VVTKTRNQIRPCFFDPNYLVFVMLPGLLLSLWASFKVKTTFQHFSQIRPRAA